MPDDIFMGYGSPCNRLDIGADLLTQVRIGHSHYGYIFHKGVSRDVFLNFPVNYANRYATIAMDAVSTRVPAEVRRQAVLSLGSPAGKAETQSVLPFLMELMDHSSGMQ